MFGLLNTCDLTIHNINNFLRTYCVKLDTHSRCCLWIKGWGNVLEGGKKKRGEASAQRVGKFSCGVMDFPGTRRRTPASANAACGCEMAPMLG